LRRVPFFEEANLGRTICIADLAVRAGLSPHHFGRAFTASTGITPHAFIEQRRIARARSQDDDVVGAERGRHRLRVPAIRRQPSVERPDSRRRRIAVGVYRLSCSPLSLSTNARIRHSRNMKVNQVNAVISSSRLEEAHARYSRLLPPRRSTPDG
jgi:hypothetical protein